MGLKDFLSKSKDIDILASLPDGVVLIDSIGNVQNVNEEVCSMFETGKTEMLRSSINDLIEGGFDLAKQAALAGKSVVGRAKSHLDKEFYIEITSRYAEDCLVVSFRDVTQNYKIVTSLLVEHESSQKVNKDKNAFLAKLSNELKSPLHSVIGFSQAMIDGLGGDMSEKQEKYIKIINKNSNELLYFLDKIIELAKAESNLYEHDFQVFDGINTIQVVIKTNEPFAVQKNLNISFDVEDVVKRTIFSDEGLLKVIMQNVLETAIKSTDVGSITVKAFHPDLAFVANQGIIIPETATDMSYLQILIADTGAGIPEADVELLFDPYKQLDKPNKKNIVRSIALASAKNLVKYLKGAIWVNSVSMQGTNYNIILPIDKF